MPETIDGNGSTAAALSRFVSERVTPLAKAFASTPLMELRLRTSEGSIRLVKSAAPQVQQRPSQAKHAARTGPKQQLMPTTESGRPYDIISADVVGIFSAAPDLPLPGAHVAEDTVLGHIEALKLKHAVRTGGPCVFVAQVVEDAQAVDFGEPLFVVDRAEVPKAAPPPAQILEPPRI